MAPHFTARKRVCLSLPLMFWLALGAACPGSAAFAQVADDEAGIRRVIHSLFKGMQEGDSAAVRRAFTSSATFATVYRDKTGAPQLQRGGETLKDFLHAVGTPHDDAWNEEIWNLEMRVDGDFAHAWCEYAFYLGNAFKHCGVDAFHLYRSNGTWKIFHLADTRRTTPCEVPDHIRTRYH